MITDYSWKIFGLELKNIDSVQVERRWIKMVIELKKRCRGSGNAKYAVRIGEVH